ncbi:natural killer cells antigen CD94-like isoform X5 [Loxodonta africana]|uniref:natural killer cells antigen CD94-like isoform X5 n=1 Tax=Loxodonta africana TaxID=9785 RepID=UPI0030CC8177
MAAFQNNLWNLISGALAVLCLLLMATLGILLKNSFATESTLPTSSPGSTLEPQRGSGCCPCQEKWIGYRCNCYFFSNEEKTWAESRDFCASHNSSLLQLESKDEFSFRISGGRYYWIGLTYNERRGAWLWEDGSALSRDLFPSFPPLNPQNCTVYKPRGTIVDQECKNKYGFICKHRHI